MRYPQRTLHLLNPSPSLGAIVAVLEKIFSRLIPPNGPPRCQSLPCPCFSPIGALQRNPPVVCFSSLAFPFHHRSGVIFLAHPPSRRCSSAAPRPSPPRPMIFRTAHLIGCEKDTVPPNKTHIPDRLRVSPPQFLRYGFCLTFCLEL